MAGESVIKSCKSYEYLSWLWGLSTVDISVLKVSVLDVSKLDVSILYVSIFNFSVLAV